VIINVLFHRQSDAGLQETEGGFYTQLFTALDTTDVDLTTLRTDLDGELDRFTNVGRKQSLRVGDESIFTM
jgi:hypothetical protein